MLLESLVMAGAVTLASIVALGGNVPIRSRPSELHDEPDSRRVGMLDIVLMVVFAVVGGFAFNVLANA